MGVELEMDHFHPQAVDGLGQALWLLTEALKTHPGIDATLRDKASRIQAQFIPSLSMLKAKYKR